MSSQPTIFTEIKNMGLVYADIELINAIDLGLVRRYKISEEEVKR